jgi:hypothetical protein
MLSSILCCFLSAFFLSYSLFFLSFLFPFFLLVFIFLSLSFLLFNLLSSFRTSLSFWHSFSRICLFFFTSVLSFVIYFIQFFRTFSSNIKVSDISISTERIMSSSRYYLRTVAGFNVWSNSFVVIIYSIYSSVGMATGYRLDGQCSIPDRDFLYFIVSRLALGLIQPPL